MLIQKFEEEEGELKKSKNDLLFLGLGEPLPICGLGARLGGLKILGISLLLVLELRLVLKIVKDVYGCLHMVNECKLMVEIVVCCWERCSWSTAVAETVVMRPDLG